MIGVFKQKNPGNLIMIFILGILLKLPWILGHPAVVLRSQDGFLYDRFVKFINPVAAVFPSIYGTLALLLIFWQAYLVTIFVNNQRLVNKPNYLPGMTLMLVSSFIPEFNYLSGPLFCSLFFLAAFIFIFRAQSNSNAKGAIFNCGLACALASMFFQPAVLFLFWSLAALAFLRPFRLNEWLLLLIGFTTPYYFYLTYLFLSDQWGMVATMIEPFSIGFHPGEQTPWFAGALFLIILPLLAGIYYINRLASKMLMQVRKGWILCLLYLATAVIIALINPGNDFTNWVLILVPCAAVHAFGYLNSELKIYPIIAFWLTVVYIVAIEMTHTFL